MKYGQVLKNQRKLAKLTQKQLAEKIGVSQQAISFIENDVNEPRIGICVALADFYGISVDELIDHGVKKNR